MSDKQTDIFSVSQSLSSKQADFAELCNALYERELLTLAQISLSNPLVAKRKLAGLSYHVKNIAHFLCQHQAPLEIDSHNASFQHKQASSSPAHKMDPEKNVIWFQKYAELGLVVPIQVQHFDHSHIELDSIDKLDKTQNRLHANKYGWFHFDGSSQLSNNQDGTEQCHHTLLKPTKAIMQAASCGHTWRHRSKAIPRALTLREMKLCANINWKNFGLKPCHSWSL